MSHAQISLRQVKAHLVSLETSKPNIVNFQVKFVELLQVLKELTVVVESLQKQLEG